MNVLGEVVEEELPGHRIGVLSGPTFARETALDYPTAVTLAFLACVVIANAQQRAVELVVRDGYAPAHGIISQSANQIEPIPQNVRDALAADLD